MNGSFDAVHSTASGRISRFYEYDCVFPSSGLPLFSAELFSGRLGYPLVVNPSSVFAGWARFRNRHREKMRRSQEEPS